LQTLQEIAAAMQYLHSHDIVHGDLTGGNVLLTSSDKDGRGFTAKVVDFGLSRVCQGGALRTKKMGCAEYMPPELITGGLLTKAGDVYAFGVVLWELYNGKRAWDGLKATEVLEKVAAHEILEFPLQTPRRLKILGEKCLSPNPTERPVFSEVVHEVNTILGDTMNILQQFLGASGH
jgi:serine/threonine protein kinase